jgi:crossover junction endodeoxyribonuclease RuvC
MDLICGIDPGLKGGVAALDRDTGALKVWWRMPTTEMRGKDVVDARALGDWIMCYMPSVIVLEQVSAMPRQGVTSSFRFGMAFGAALSCAQFSQTRLELVTPATWKKKLGLSSSKRASLDAAATRFGQHSLWGVQANDGVAEAALLAAWWIDKQGAAA